MTIDDVAKFEQQTAAEMVHLLARDSVHRAIVERIAALEKQYRSIGAIVRLSFDLPVMRWGAYLSVWYQEDGKLNSTRYTQCYGGITAEYALATIERAFAEKFWLKAPTEEPCRRCGNTGVECYVDSEDNDYHLRSCDCSAGRAKKAEIYGENPPKDAR